MEVSFTDGLLIWLFVCSVPLLLIILYCLLFFLNRTKWIVSTTSVRIRKLVFLILSPILLVIFFPIALMGTVFTADSGENSFTMLLYYSLLGTSFLVLVLWIQTFFIKAKQN